MSYGDYLIDGHENQFAGLIITSDLSAYYAERAATFSLACLKTFA